ncbi:MAG: PKD domain-containing protein [Chitinophagales bacterium]|nr:PKD domain-containing protein [Chitinophagales bacterium]
MKLLVLGMLAGAILLFCSANVFSQPVASFTVQYPTSPCLPVTVNFINTSTGDSLKSYWSFGVDSTSVSFEENPSYTYNLCGTFQVILKIADVSGNTSSDTQQVAIDCPPHAAFTALDSNSCSPSLFCLISESENASAYSWLIYNSSKTVFLSSHDNNPCFILTNPDYYSAVLIVSDTAGCTDTLTKSDYLLVSIVEANFHASLDSGCGSLLINFFDSSLVEGDSTVTWSWNFGDPESDSMNTSFQQNPSHLYDSSGSFVVSLTVTGARGCSSTALDTILVFSAPGAAFTLSDSVVCADAAIQFSDQSSPQGKIDQWQWNFNDVSSGSDDVSQEQNPVHVFHNPGLYSIQLNVITSEGCLDSIIKSITVFNNPVINAGSDQTICSSDSVHLMASGGVSYVWTPSEFLSDSASSSPFAFPPLSTLFFVTGVDTNGCSAKDSILVNVQPFPFISAGNDTSICSGTFAILHASGADSYQWTSSSTLSNDTIPNPIATPTTTTIYIVSTTDPNGCIGSDSVTVNVVPIPTISITNLKTDFCSEDTAITLIAIPDGGTFSGPGITGNLFNPSLLEPGEYFISYYYIDSIGCSGADTVTIHIHSNPIVSIAPDTAAICGGSTPFIFNLLPSGGILFGKGIVNNQLIPSIAGEGIDTISYFFIDSVGCSGTDTALITILNLPVIHANGDTSICKGDTVQLIANGAKDYFWSPGNFLSNDSIADPLAFPDSTTTFVVTTVNSAGCSNSDSVFVQVLPIPVANAGIDISLCAGDSAQLHASGGTFYSWSPSRGLSDPLVSDPYASPDSTIQYKVVVLNGTECVSSDSLIVTVNALPVINAGRDTAICLGDSIQLLVTGGLVYEWSPSSSLSDPSSSQPFSFPNTNTTYFVKGSDVNGCSVTDSVKVSLLAAPHVNAGGDIEICLGDTVNLNATGALSYHWSPSFFLTNADIPNPFAFPSSTTLYIVTGSDTNVCNGFDTVLITVNPLPVADAGTDQIVCAEKMTQLNASGGISYFWIPGRGLSDSTISNPLASITSSITYSVFVTDSNDCSALDSIHLELEPLISSFAYGDTTICEGDEASLHAGGGTYYAWFPSNLVSDPTIANPTTSPPVTTTFTVTVSDGVCYTDTFNINVQTEEIPFISAGADVTISSGESYSVPASASQGTYQWSPPEGLSCTDCLNPVASPEQTTTYTVTVSDSIGCKTSDDITVVIGCENAVFVPNAFTPNGNGKNDILYVRAAGLSKLHFFRVYSRWGKIIFESDDIEKGWDGNLNGKPMPPGVFLYTLEAECGNGTLIQKQGNITLIR